MAGSVFAFHISEIPFDMIDKKAIASKVVIGVGWKPGWSSDYGAVLLAQDYNTGMVINLSNIDMVYDKDPKKFKDAKPIRTIRWKEMVGIVGKKWKPGLNMPFDPIASKLAMESNIKVIICNGHNLKNLNNIL